jgi:hypothetical protein
VEAIGFYDGLSFVLSVVRQFFKLDNLAQQLDLGSKTLLTHGYQVHAADF